MSDQAVYKLLSKRRSQAGMPPLSLHDLRRTWVGDLWTLGRMSWSCRSTRSTHPPLPQLDTTGAAGGLSAERPTCWMCRTGRYRGCAYQMKMLQMPDRTAE